MRFRTLLSPATLACILFSGAAHAGPCDAHFTFDGNLSDASGNGYDGRYIGKGGGAATDAPSYGEGKHGQALLLSGAAAVRAPIDLSKEVCPQVTISAWVKFDDDPTQGTQYIFSSGRGGPNLSRAGIGLDARGGNHREYVKNALRGGRWEFIAMAVDQELGKMKVYWRQRVFERDTKPVGTVSADIWIGAIGDDLRQPVLAGAIDDVHVYGGILTAEELAMLPEGRTSGEVSDEAAVAEATCTVHDDCGSGSYCGWDNTCHPESHAPKQELEFGVVSASPAAGGFIVSDDARGDGQTLDELNEELAERNAASESEQAAMQDAFNENRPLDLNTLGAGSGSGESTAPEEPQYAGPAGGMAEISVKDALMGINFHREPSGDVRDCHSFAEVTADIATAARDAVVDVASGAACGLLALPLRETDAAASIADAAGYETDEFREKLLEETYGRCINTAEDVSKVPDAAIRFWNSATGGNTWATIGPRKLTIGETHPGNLVSPGDRKFITDFPVMDRNSATLVLQELDGRARVTARVCTVSPFSVYQRLYAFSVNETPDERDNQNQLTFWDLNNVRGKQVIVYLDAAGRLGRNFKYELTVE